MSDINLEVFLAAASRHGADSVPDHEVGDLQDYFRAAFSLLTPDQKRAFISDNRVVNAMVSTLAYPDQANDSPVEIYASLAMLTDDVTTHPTS